MEEVSKEYSKNLEVKKLGSSAVRDVEVDILEKSVNFKVQVDRDLYTAFNITKEDIKRIIASL